MLHVSLYIIGCSLRNRVRRWVVRLREPRYLAFAIAGAAYLIFLLVLRVRSVSLASGATGMLAPIDELPRLAEAGPTLAAFLLVVAAAASWLFPGGGLLRFTRAEMQFLFPGPVSRRTLVAYRMLRSQLGLLFGSIISALVIPSGSGAMRIRLALTLWVLLFTAKVYFSGITLTRARITSTNARERFIGRSTVAVVLGAFLIAMASLARAYAQPIIDVADAASRLNYSSMPMATQVALWPFAALARPLFADGWSAFLQAFAWDLVVLAVVSLWVVTSDDTFERVAAEAGLRRNHRPGTRGYRAGKAPWTLSATGRSEMAFAWKSALQTFRVVDRRVIVRVFAVLVWIAVVIVTSNQGRGLAVVAAHFAIAAAGLAVVIGPLTVKLDFREDLQHLELLKTWPVAPAAAVRGVMVWPTLLLTTIAWAMMALALLFSGSVFPDVSPVVRVTLTVASMVVSPGLIAAQLTIHNAAALAFPAWMATGGDRSKGLDAIGQRLLLIGGTMTILALMTVPGVAVGWGAWSLLSPGIGVAALVPAAVLCSAVLVGEVLAAAKGLAPRYERLDLMAVERGE